MKNYILFGMMIHFLFALTPPRLCAETANEGLSKSSVHGQSVVTVPQSGGEATGLVYDNNIGFMKDVPRELHEALPMCDEFLDVKWIREMPGGYWVGRVIVDVSAGEKKEQRELVVLEEERLPGRLKIFDITTSSYRGLQFEALIMSADAVSSVYTTPDSDILRQGLSVFKERKRIMAVEGLIGSQSSLERGLASRFVLRSNKKICITLPAKERWLINKK